jgi:hypothetical protein
MIEAEQGHKSVNYPSWVPRVKCLTTRIRDDHITVSESSLFFHFSAAGCKLTLEGTFIGEIISCSCIAEFSR